MQTADIAVKAAPTLTITKPTSNHPAFSWRIDDGVDALFVLGGLVVNRDGEATSFPHNDAVRMPSPLRPGSDYEIALNAESQLEALLYGAAADRGWPVVGGFHFAPCAHAGARGGAEVPVPFVNPHSIYDLNWRPACPDPRGMALIDGAFWCDIYLLGKNHKAEGTSRWGASIADGKSLSRLNYADAVAIMAEHGKQLLGVTEFWAAAFGVQEKASRDDEPETTEIGDQDLPFVSKWGIQQATGCMWVWGHNEDPDDPRASLFGGSWFDGSYAGSRDAYLDYWPGHSDRDVGARGRSDHLTHAG